jgi:hypothetical protein
MVLLQYREQTYHDIMIGNKPIMNNSPDLKAVRTVDLQAQGVGQWHCRLNATLAINRIIV